MAIPKGAQKAGKVQPAKAIKEGQVKKNKQPKFKQTPKGKVQLVHNKKNGNANAQKAIDNSPKKNSGNNKQVDNKNLNKKQAQKKKNEALKKNKKEEEEEDDSEDDINEGIAIPEDLSGMEDDDDDDDDDDESSVDEKVNLLGESLADDSDDDDDDFEADSDDEASSKVKKGLKMFEGLKSVGKNKSAEKQDDDEEDDDDDDDDDDEDEEMDQSTASANTSMSTDDDDDDDDDDDEDDNDESEDDAPGLKALLGNSLVDEEDDEDFQGDEDDDDDEDIEDSDEEDEPQNVSTQSNTSNLSTASKEEKVLSPEEKAEQDKRSIYVGNVPKDIKESRIKSEFNKFGPIESLRIRGVVPESPKMSFKVAAIKKKFHEKCTTICVFIVFKSEESAVKALAMNGKQLDGFYLRVDRVNQEKKRDPKKSVFLGNLPFDVQDNELWEMFLKCGKIEDVRTVRDRVTAACRGIAYINFKTEDAATLALNLNGTELRNREIRVQRYQQQPAGSNQGKSKAGHKRAFKNKNQGTSPKRVKKNEEGENEGTVNPKGMKKEKKPRDSSEVAKKSPAQSDDSFQGQTADAKKKGKKANKFEKKKKNMAGKLMSKPKKPIS